MDRNIEEWIEKDGKYFLERIGIKKKQLVLDFGCNIGHYTIPLSKAVGNEGRVFAFDKDIYELNRLVEIIKRKQLDNIRLIAGKTLIPLKDNLLHSALCFDVIHYEKRRKLIYSEIYRVLKKGGQFFLYPKHNKDDYPMMELAKLSIEDIKREVMETRFVFGEDFFDECLHDGTYNRCLVLKFIKERL